MLLSKKFLHYQKEKQLHLGREFTSHEFSYFTKMWYNINMNTAHKTKESGVKSFSVSNINREKIKERSFDTMRTSFSIEGIRFTDAQFKGLKTGHLQK